MRFRNSRSLAVHDSVAARSPSRERERGLALVEFAIVVPLLLLIVTGIMDFGFLFRDVISVRQGVRDGGRQAAVGSFGTDTSCSLTGFTSSGSGAAVTNAQKLLCLTKSRSDLGDTQTRIRLVVGQSGCNPAADCYMTGRPITICQEYKARTLTGMLPFLSGRVITTRASQRVEVPNIGGLASSQETSFNGGQILCTAPAPVS